MRTLFFHLLDDSNFIGLILNTYPDKVRPFAGVGNSFSLKLDSQVVHFLRNVLREIPKVFAALTWFPPVSFNVLLITAFSNFNMSR